MSTKKVLKQEKVIAKKEITQPKTKLNRLNKKPEEREGGIIYLGHLPYGFLEEGMKEYFTQFGDVLGVKLFRSKKTNRSQGYGFVKFQDKQVADIAAKTMNGYFMNEKKIVSHLLSDEHPDPFKYKHGAKKLHFINWSSKFTEDANKAKTDEQVKKEVEHLLANEEEKRKKLKELGINYTYKGFVSILSIIRKNNFDYECQYNYIISNMYSIRLQQTAQDLSIEEISILIQLSNTDILIQQISELVKLQQEDILLFHHKDGYKKRIINGWSCSFYSFEPNDIIIVKAINGQTAYFKQSQTDSMNSVDEFDQSELIKTRIQQFRFNDNIYEIVVDSIKNDNGKQILETLNQEILEINNVNNWNLLHWLCYYGRLEIIQHINLQGYKYNINQTTNDGWTLLFIAIRQNQIQIFNYLINYNAINLNIVTIQGSALHLAIKMANRQIIKQLLSYGANPLIQDLQGNTCYQIANEQTRLDLLAITNNLPSVSEIQIISQIKGFKAKGLFYTPGTSPWTVKRRYLNLNPINDSIQRCKDKNCQEPCLTFKLSAIIDVQKNYESFNLKSGYIYILIVYSDQVQFLIGLKTQELIDRWTVLIRQAISYVKNQQNGIQLQNVFEPILEIDLDDLSIMQLNSQTIKPAVIPELPQIQLPQLPQINMVKFSDFEITSLLGQGAFGCVFQAKCRKDNHIYAVKVMSKKKAIDRRQLKYTVSEVQILKKLNHPYIVKLQYAFQTPNNLYLAMELCSGGDLYGLLQKYGYFKEEIAKFYLAEILLGLEYLHNLDIVYRDLKPENILLTSEGHLKIADFGLCKQNVPFELATKSFCGSPAYLPPELLAERKVGKYGDYYTYGVIAYELLTGMPPFLGNTLQEVYQKIQKDTIEFPRFLSSKAINFINEFTKKNPYKRMGFNNAKRHPFFEGIDWNQMEINKIKPPPLNGKLQSGRFEGIKFNDQDYSEIDLEERVIEYEYMRE